MVRKSIEKIYMVMIFTFLYAPIVTLIIFSFNKNKSRAKWGGFSLKWYESMLSDPSIAKALYYTLIVALLSAIIATIVGTIAAIGISNMRGFYKKTVMNLTYLPVLNPDIVTGIALMLLFIFINLKLGFTSLLLAHITFNIPYVILCVLPKLKQLNKYTYEAALDLGATKSYALTKVILPEIMPGVITGFLLAFTLSLDDFVISYFTTGNGISNLSITIYTMTKRGVKPEINALSTVMFVTVLILLIIINKRIKTDKEAQPHKRI
ncbi:spermidine/putrescine ABC transporter permease [Vallitalea longa]|uniref:Spermidine/putrescine ABC transporter permease n=1 Tax=Vallitalea longa TaxID=2936439 RepID=A0A9W6DF55_9FIRM|nr:ABC transporter permease [Vallitalea longa]GKX29132.1 spermidine/putrescine ABC transporter permease [Vallitalea longa]